MTATRDPDRLIRAWLELMPDEAPDRVVSAVLQAAEAAPQVRAWPRLPLWRPQMNRLSLIAATAVIALALVGGAVLMSTGAPRPTPTPTLAPSRTPATPMSSALSATWVADLRAPGDTAAGPAGVTKLFIKDGLVWTELGSTGNRRFVSQGFPGAPNEMTIGSRGAVDGCEAGDVGRYGYTFANPEGLPDAGDLVLRLSLISDACSARATMLARSWVRATEAAHSGGRSVATQFAKMFLITMPAGAYPQVSHNTPNALMIEGNTGGLVVAGNPWGYTDPCSATGGAKLPLAPTIDAFVAYLDSLPGFSVEQTSVEIDGRPAFHLTVPTTPTPECQKGGPDNGRIAEFTNDDPLYPGGWIIGQGVTDSMYLLELDGKLYLFQWFDSPSTPEKEMAVLSTIRFIEELPS